MVTNESIKDDKTIDATVLLTGIVSEEDGQFASYCRELGTASCGDSVEEAFENLWDAVDIHIEALEETGELLHFLKERNIRIALEGEQFGDEEPYLRVPLGKFLNICPRSIPLPTQ